MSHDVHFCANAACRCHVRMPMDLGAEMLNRMTYIEANGEHVEVERIEINSATGASLDLCSVCANVVNLINQINANDKHKS